jgi:hypothetical protein
MDTITLVSDDITATLAPRRCALRAPVLFICAWGHSLSQPRWWRWLAWGRAQGEAARAERSVPTAEEGTTRRSAGYACAALVTLTPAAATFVCRVSCVVCRVSCVTAPIPVRSAPTSQACARGALNSTPTGGSPLTSLTRRPPPPPPQTIAAGCCLWAIRVAVGGGMMSMTVVAGGGGCWWWLVSDCRSGGTARPWSTTSVRTGCCGSTPRSPHSAPSSRSATRLSPPFASASASSSNPTYPLLRRRRRRRLLLHCGVAPYGHAACCASHQPESDRKPTLTNQPTGRSQCGGRRCRPADRPR